MIVTIVIATLFTMIITLGGILYLVNATKYEYKYPLFSLLAYLIWPISIIIVFVYLAFKNLRNSKKKS